MHEVMIMKKGQAVSMDFIIAFLIFLSIISLFAYLWSTISLPSGMQQKSFSVSDYLLSHRLGEESVINCTKLSEIAFKDYESLRSELNANPYEVWIEFSDMDGSLCPAIRRDLDVMLVLDRSGSMSGQKLADAKTAAKGFVDKLNGTFDQGGLVSFSTAAALNQQLLVMDSTNKTTLKGKIDSLSANGYTNIGDAISAATTELVSARGRGSAARVQVLLSDGEANRPFNDFANSYAKDRQYAVNKSKQACKNSTAIYAISLGDGADRGLMQEIANITSGKEYYAPTSEQLQEIFDEIASEITVSRNYGKVAPQNAKVVSSVTRLVLLNGRMLRMNVRLYEKVEDEKICE